MRAPLTAGLRPISNKLFAFVVLCLLLALTAGSTLATASTKCFVIGDTSGNNPSKLMGSQGNPYGYLSYVEIDIKEWV